MNQSDVRHMREWLLAERDGKTKYANPKQRIAAFNRAEEIFNKAVDDLRIATEALEDISVAEFYETTCTSALSALARIKEVG